MNKIWCWLFGHNYHPGHSTGMIVLWCERCGNIRLITKKQILRYQEEVQE